MPAVVLSGGGAYGAYEVGILKGLFETGRLRKLKIVTGTSVGAFNASVMAMEGAGEPAVKRLENIWRTRIVQNARGMNGVLRIRGDLLSYLNPAAFRQPVQSAAQLWNDSVFLARAGLAQGAAFVTSKESILTRAIETLDASAFFCCEPLKKTIASEINLPKLQASDVDLRVVATNWELGEARVFDNSTITDEAILASTAIPGIFPPVHFDNTTWVDGGVTMNTPLKPAIAAGASEIHVISLDPHLHSIPATELDSSAEALLRTFIISVGTVIREDLATADWINRGIAVIERTKAGEPVSNEAAREFTKVAAQIHDSLEKNGHLRQLTIHHYHPCKPLGGPLGLLNFRSAAVSMLIERGYHDALTHDCRESGCVLPQK